MTALPRLVTLIAALMLGACALPGQRTEVPQTYVLEWQGLPSPVLAPPEPCHVLLVNAPGSAPGFATARMAYVEQPYQLNYFAYHQWASTPARMLQPLIVQAMEESGQFQAVAEAPTRIESDVRLETEVLQLQQVFEPTGKSRMELALRARLLASGRPLASRVFRFDRAATRAAPYGGVITANQLVEELLRALVEFTGTELNRVPCKGH